MLFIKAHKQANICLLFFRFFIFITMRHFESSFLLLICFCFSSPSFINIRLWWNYNKQQNSFSHSKTLDSNMIITQTISHQRIGKKRFSLSACVFVCALKCTCLLCYNAFSFILCLFSLVQHIDVSLVYCLLAHINAIQKPQIDGKYEF